jgi:hypothetical protein
MLLKIATMLALTATLAACHQTDIGRSVGFPSPQERSGQP